MKYKALLNNFKTMKTKIITSIILFSTTFWIVWADYDYLNSNRSYSNRTYKSQTSKTNYCNTNYYNSNYYNLDYRNDDSWIYIVPLNYDWDLEKYKNSNEYYKYNNTSNYNNYNPDYNNLNRIPSIILDESSDLTIQYINTIKWYLKNLSSTQQDKVNEIIQTRLDTINKYKEEFRTAMKSKNISEMKNALASVIDANNSLFSSLKKYVKWTYLDEFNQTLQYMNDYQTTTKQSVIDKIELYY